MYFAVPIEARVLLMKQLGLGVVGCGDFGLFSSDVYASMPQVRLVAVTDTDITRRNTAESRYKVRAYAFLSELLADPQVDIVVIATPPWLHGPQAIAAADAGKHIFVEKPLATTREDADTLQTLVQSNKLRLNIDYVLRHVPLYDTLRRVVKSGLLGNVTYTSLENNASNEALHSQHWFWDRSRSGGILVEHGVHFFDLCTQISGSYPVEVSGYAHTEFDGRQDRVLASVRYANGMLANFYHAFDRSAILEHTVLHVVMERGSATAYGWIPQRLEVEGTLPPHHYTALAELLGTELELREVPAPDGVTGSTSGTLARATLLRSDRASDYAHAVRTGMADFVRSIHEPEYTPEVTIQDAYNSLRLALTAQASIDEGHSMIYEG